MTDHHHEDEDEDTMSSRIHAAVQEATGGRPFVVVWLHDVQPAPDDAPMGAVDAGMGLSVCSMSGLQVVQVLNGAAFMVATDLCREEAEENIVQDFRETLGLPDEETPR